MSAQPSDPAVPDDTPELGLFAQIRSFNGVYWIANTMEMFERLAYYGLRTVLPVYMVLSLEEGGPQFDHVQKGAIYAWWALVQSGLPVFTGGYADRYGYKNTVAVAIAVKIVGYLVMAYAVDIASAITGGVSATVPGHGVTYAVFLVGSLGLAGGTAIFKPGLQGIISLQLNEKTSSVGWSVFYQIVNVGGFLGPFLAGWMRLLDWKYVFIACAIIVSLNYVFLLAFPEPEKETGGDEQGVGFLGALKVLWQSAIGICEPRLMAFLVVFSGFWAMFHQLFDLLPNYIDDWVDSSAVAQAVAAPLFGLFGSTMPEAWGGNLPQEYMININAGMCMLLAFLIGFATGKVRSMTAMIAGIFVASAAIYGLGVSTDGWFILLAIAMFSLGELMSSPTKMRYFANIAPPGKKGLYLGYINATGGIGWFLGSRIAGTMYEEGGDKVVLARRYLVEQLGQDAGMVQEMAKTEVLPTLAAQLDQTPDAVRTLLFTTYDPSFVWTHFALIGLVSMFGLLIFDFVTKQKLAIEPYILLLLTGFISLYTYGWIPAVFFSVCILAYLFVEHVAPQWLPTGQARTDAESSADAA
ncbi:MAG: dipeptide/tripeptide permease [Myxococcota bacterium]|jgi:dipeptide/tripeptide permease